MEKKQFLSEESIDAVMGGPFDPADEHQREESERLIDSVLHEQGILSGKRILGEEKFHSPLFNVCGGMVPLPEGRIPESLARFMTSLDGRSYSDMTASSRRLLWHGVRLSYGLSEEELPCPFGENASVSRQGSSPRSVGSVIPGWRDQLAKMLDGQASVFWGLLTLFVLLLSFCDLVVSHRDLSMIRSMSSHIEYRVPVTPGYWPVPHPSPYYPPVH